MKLALSAIAIPASIIGLLGGRAAATSGSTVLRLDNGVQSLLNLTWSTRDYDTPICPKSTSNGSHPCLIEITFFPHVRDFFQDCTEHACPHEEEEDMLAIQVMDMGAHCQEESCRSMELYNADTKSLICRVVPTKSGEAPCLFAPDVFSPVLSLNTALLALKHVRVSSSSAHPVEVAMAWSMHGVLVPNQDHLPSELPRSGSEDSQDEKDNKQREDAIKLQRSKTFLLFVFGAWALACFSLAMFVWGMAFRPKEPEFDFHGVYTDLVLEEEMIV